MLSFLLSTTEVTCYNLITIAFEELSSLFVDQFFIPLLMLALLVTSKTLIQIFYIFLNSIAFFLPYIYLLAVSYKLLYLLKTIYFSVEILSLLYDFHMLRITREVFSCDKHSFSNLAFCNSEKLGSMVI